MRAADVASETDISTLRELTLEGISTVFESLGRALVCVDSSFRVVRASRAFDVMVGPGAADKVVGQPLEKVLGEACWGPTGRLRRALESGERREGWGATLRLDGFRPRFVSVTAAPLQHDEGGICDPRVVYLIVLRPGADDSDAGTARPIFFSGMVARSARMRRIFDLVEHLSESDATVLVTGESGTGKELVARAVHTHSPRAADSFVAVNCGALPADLLESELFGHARGAFTGAVRDRVGRFELAGRGTLLLDEIGELPLQLQVKLLRVLQDGTFERVGESTPRTANARIIAATNRNLSKAVADGEFRHDLYYRLRVVPIEVPPLRDRREDIEPLARHLLDRVSRRLGRAPRLSSAAMRALLAYDWPGNVRELENALEYAIAVGSGQTMHEGDLPVEVQGTVRPEAADGPAADSAGVPDAERPGQDPSLLASLQSHRWNRAATARALGISRTTLWRRMREAGLLA